MFMQADQTPEEVMKSHDSKSKEHCNRIYMIINKGMHGLQDTGELANEQHHQHLVSYGNRPTPHTSGL